GVAPIYYSGDIRKVNVNVGAATETINVQSTSDGGVPLGVSPPASAVTAINLGNGFDTVNVGDSLNRLVQQRLVTVNGQNRYAILKGIDQGTQTSETYTIMDNMVSLTSGGVAPIYYSHIQQVEVSAGAATETINVQSTSASAVDGTVIRGGAGTDVVTVGN